MSHFTVLVKVKSEKLKNNELQDIVEEMLAPYQENNMGDCPKQYLEFNDHTEEVMKDIHKVITADSYMGRNHSESIGKTLLEFYDNDVDKYAYDYHGYKKDPETGKYGYFENPNKKWDWWVIGGRWRGLLRLKETAKSVFGGKSWTNEEEPDQPHSGDVCQVKDFDIEGAREDALVKAKEFWEKYLLVQKHEREGTKPERAWDSFDVHERLMSLGIRKCVKPRKVLKDENGEPIMEEDTFLGKGQMVPKWSKPEFETKEFTLEDLQSTYLWGFEFGTYAVLDDEGWHSKGDMGWWGCSSDNQEARQKWGQSYLKNFIENEDPDTYLAVVDCHI